MSIISHLGRYAGISQPPVIPSSWPHRLPGETEKRFIRRALPENKIDYFVKKYGQVLWLGLNKAEDKDLLWLEDLPHTTRLFLADGLITDLGVSSLPRLVPNLHVLDLAYCENLTDKGLVHLPALSKMKKLSLPHTSISDAGLPSLLQLPKDMKELDVSYTGISKAGAIALERNFPGVIVDYNV